MGDLGSIPGLGRSPGEMNGYSLQCSCLENPMDRGAWETTVQEITKSWTQLRTNTFTSFLILQNSAPPHPKFFSLALKVSTTVPVMGLFGDFHGMPRFWMTLDLQCMVVPRVNALTHLASLKFYCDSVMEEGETRLNVYTVPRICQAL